MALLKTGDRLLPLSIVINDGHVRIVCDGDPTCDWARRLDNGSDVHNGMVLEHAITHVFGHSATDQPFGIMRQTMARTMVDAFTRQDEEEQGNEAWLTETMRKGPRFCLVCETWDGHSHDCSTQAPDDGAGRHDGYGPHAADAPRVGE